MAISDGQPVAASASNAAWMSRTTDTSTIGIIELLNTEPESGDSLANLQGGVNNLFDQTGMASWDDPNRKVYSSTNVISNGDSLKQAIEAIDAFIGSGGGGIIGITDSGSGEGLANGVSGSNVVVKSLLGSNGIQVIDNGADLSIIGGGLTFETRSVTGNVNLSKPTTNVLVIQGDPDEIRSLGAPTTASDPRKVILWFISITTQPIIVDQFVGAGSAEILGPWQRDIQVREYNCVTLFYDPAILKWVVESTSAQMFGFADGSTITGSGTYDNPLVSSGGGLPTGNAYDIFYLDTDGVTPITGSILKSAADFNDSLDFLNRKFFDSIGIEVLDYENKKFYVSGGAPLADRLTIDWQFQQLFDRNAVSRLSLDWQDRYLYDGASTPVISVAWGGSRSLYDSFGNVSAEWGERKYYDPSGNPVLNLSNTAEAWAPYRFKSGDAAIFNTANTRSAFSDDNDGGFYISEWQSTGDRGGNLYYANTNTLIMQHSWNSSGSTEPVGSALALLDPSHMFSFSWDASDYKTYFRDHRLYLGGANSYANIPTLNSIEGKFVQAIDGNSGLNNYYWTGVLDTADGSPSYYNRIVDIASTEYQNLVFMGNASQGLSGGYNPGFAGHVHQLKPLTDGTDTGWGFQLNNEPFARFQIGGDSTYEMQVRNASGNLIGGFRGLRPVVNSGNVTPQTLTPTGNYIEFVDETGTSVWVPTYA